MNIRARAARSCYSFQLFRHTSNSIAQLKWQSGTESNFNHYELQKSVKISSSDGNNDFATIANVAATGSNRNTIIAVLNRNKLLLSLKMVDNDGQSNTATWCQSRKAILLQMS
jgi:hypothetical protein